MSARLARKKWSVVDGWVDGWMDGWMDGWVDGSKSRVKDCLQQSKRKQNQCSQVTAWRYHLGSHYHTTALYHKATKTIDEKLYFLLDTNKIVSIKYLKKKIMPTTFDVLIENSRH